MNRVAVRLVLAALPLALLAAACEPQLYGETEAPTNDGSRDPLTWSEPGDPNCSFPNGADAAKIDAAVVIIRVLVKSDGTPQAVQTLDEPGFGFGQAATRCAMARRYTPGVDARGTPVSAWTPPIRLRFVR